MTSLPAAVSADSPAWTRARHAIAERAVSWPLLAVGGATALVLLAVSAGYGFHRDELYFIVAGRHPAFGYVDQPPLTPLLSAASAALFGVSPTAIRLLPAFAAAAVVVLAGLIAAEFGGSRRAQLIAAIVTAASGVLAEGHLDHTTTYDLLAWAAMAWLVARVLSGGDRRLWSAVGLVAGLALENKDTPLFLAAGLAVGVVAARRWDVVFCRWTWAGLALALVVWAPNLVWQAANGWPEVTMAHAIAGDADTNRMTFLPMLLLFAGPLLSPVSIAGFGWLALARSAARWRPLGIAFAVIVALDLVSGGKFYYACAFVPVLIAAGSIVVDRRLSGARAGARKASFAAAAVMSGTMMAILVLPILPPATLAATPIPSIITDSAEQIGWPQLAATVRGAVEELPAAERSHAVIVTANYAQASAIELLGPGLPPVYSGHNSFWYWGPPPADRTAAVLVGFHVSGRLATRFGDCRLVAEIDNGFGIDNQEQGEAVTVCTGLRTPWSDIWPNFKHVD